MQRLIFLLVGFLVRSAGGWRSSDAAVAPTPYYTGGSGKVNDFFDFLEGGFSYSYSGYLSYSSYSSYSSYGD